MAKKTKLPKSVLGVKIPKDLRKRGGKLLDAANSPEGREMVAGVMGMAAAAMGAIAAKNAARAQYAADAPPPHPAPPPVPPVPPHAGPPQFEQPHGTTREPDFQAIAETIGKSAELLIDRMFGPRKV